MIDASCWWWLRSTEKTGERDEHQEGDCEQQTECRRKSSPSVDADPVLTSDKLSPLGIVFEQTPQVIGSLLKNLSAAEITKCARVCKSWRLYANKILDRRRARLCTYVHFLDLLYGDEICIRYIQEKRTV